VRQFHAEASEFSRPLFEKFGFSVVETEVVNRSGVRFERFRVERPAGLAIRVAARGTSANTPGPGSGAARFREHRSLGSRRRPART
jgi:hypothetical protein